MSQDNININIEETNDIVNIVSSEVTELIDINVGETVEEVTLNITEEIIQVNINKVTNISPVNSVNGLTGDVVLDIPTATSDLTNDSNFVSDASYVHTDNNFTTAEQTKLAGIEAGAEVNVNADWNATSGDAQILNKPTIPSAGVTSVGLTMPSAFSVTNSPITSTGDIAVTGAGLVSQYVRGDGTLANFPTSTGGGASVNYYLNGSISQGTFGGTTYYQMSKTPILGAGTNFTRTNGAGNGYIASFITDAGDPSFLNIPGGNWNLEFYFQSSSSGGSPQFYGEIYKVSATNVFTLIASGSANPEGITNGTTVDQYFTSIPVPQTSLLITDRLAIRIYVITGGRTITLHTENGNLSEVLTTFTTGLTALNGLTSQVQYFAVGTSGTDFNISSATDTHTFNLPTASATNRGALSSTDWTTFNSKQNALGFTAESVANKSTNTSLGTSDTLYPTQNAVKVYADTKLTKNNWIDYSATSTIVGWSSFTVKEIWILIIGDILFCQFALIGTSNSTTTSFTINNNNPSLTLINVNTYVVNNGATQVGPGRIVISNGSNVVSLSRQADGAVYSATGIKQAAGQFFMKL